jgi:hypothetical protein
MSGKHGAHVLVIGAGGNIGSRIGPDLARSDRIGRITLVDFDRYEESNLRTQSIERADIGRMKVEVQAERLTAINPSLRIDALCERIEHVPRGLLACDVILAGLDSPAARQHVNEIAWFFGVPWIDAGVSGADRYVRVSAYAPGDRARCLECGWDDRHYGILARRYRCTGDTDAPPPTNAPASLGAAAAAVAVGECEKILSGCGDLVPFGSEVFMDLSHHAYYVSAVPFNPACRFAGHRERAATDIEPCSSALSIAELLERSAEGTLAVPGRRLVTRLTCGRCGNRSPFLHLDISLARARRRRCDSCGARGGELVGAGFDTRAEVDAGTLTERQRTLSLDTIGLRRGDILRVRSRNGAERFYIAAGISGGAGSGRRDIPAANIYAGMNW